MVLRRTFCRSPDAREFRQATALKGLAPAKVAGGVVNPGDRHRRKSPVQGRGPEKALIGVRSRTGSSFPPSKTGAPAGARGT